MRFKVIQYVPGKVIMWELGIGKFKIIFVAFNSKEAKVTHGDEAIAVMQKEVERKKSLDQMFQK